MSNDGQEWAQSAESEDDFAFDGGEYSSDDLGGSSVNKVGWYHFEVADVRLDLSTVNLKGKEQSPCIHFDLVVVHTHSSGEQSPAGAKLYHKQYVGSKGGGPAAEGSKKSTLRFGLGCGVLGEVCDEDGKKRIVVAGTTNSKIKPSDFLAAKGRQIIAQVVKTEAQGNFGEKYELPFGRCFQVDDPAVADVEKSVDMLRLIGKESAAPKPGAKPPNGQGGAAKTDSLPDDL